MPDDTIWSGDQATNTTDAEQGDLLISIDDCLTTFGFAVERSGEASLKIKRDNDLDLYQAIDLCLDGSRQAHDDLAED